MLGSGVRVEVDSASAGSQGGKRRRGAGREDDAGLGEEGSAAKRGCAGGSAGSRQWTSPAYDAFVRYVVRRERTRFREQVCDDLTNPTFLVNRG